MSRGLWVSLRILFQCNAIKNKTGYFFPWEKNSYRFSSLWEDILLCFSWILNYVSYTLYLKFVTRTSLPPAIAELNFLLGGNVFLLLLESAFKTAVDKNSKHLRKRGAIDFYFPHSNQRLSVKHKLNFPFPWDCQPHLWKFIWENLPG